MFKVPYFTLQCPRSLFQTWLKTGETNWQMYWGIRDGVYLVWLLIYSVQHILHVRPSFDLAIASAKAVAVIERRGLGI